MNNNFFELGVICGRFGHIHYGHKYLFDISINLCKTTLILVGSAQEVQTLRNPFSIKTRIDTIKNIYPDLDETKFLIRGINDLTNEYDLTTDWGKYVNEQIKNYTNKKADLLIYGNDESRETWFSPEDIKTTSRLIIPRSNISATSLRGYLTIDDKDSWKKATPPEIHNMYNQLRLELLEVPIYKEIYDKISKSTLSLDNFMKLYKSLEKLDKEEKIKNI